MASLEKFATQGQMDRWLWIELKQAMDVPQVATEWYELYVSLGKQEAMWDWCK